MASQSDTMAIAALLQAGPSPSIKIKPSPLGGLGVFAACAFKPGDEMLRCPGTLLITPSLALGHEEIGPPLTELKKELGELLNDSALTILCLLHHRRAGRASAFYPYLASLPGRTHLRIAASRLSIRCMAAR